MTVRLNGLPAASVSSSEYQRVRKRKRERERERKTERERDRERERERESMYVCLPLEEYLKQYDGLVLALFFFFRKCAVRSWR